MDIETKVTKAAVYFRGAEVCRKGAAALQEGISQIRIAGIPQSADKESLRVRFPGGIKATDIRFTDSRQTCREELEDLEDRKKELTEKIRFLQEQNEQWKAIGRANQPAVDLDQLKEYTRGLPDLLLGTYREISALEKELAAIEEKIEEVCDRVRRPVLDLSLAAGRAGEYPFEIEYYDLEPSWQPQYEFHSAGPDAPVEIILKGIISQDTGEDWEDAEVTLRTGAAFAGNEEPRISPAGVEFRTDRYVMGRPSLGKMSYAAAVPAAGGYPEGDLEGTFGGYTDGEPLEPMKTESARARMEESWQEFILSGRKTIPCGADRTVEVLQTFSAAARYEMRAVPKRDEHAFITAVIDEKDMPQMLEADAAVFYRDSYVGRMSAAPQAGTSEYRISLGRAEGIRTWRKADAGLRSRKGLLKGRSRQEQSYEIHVTSSMAADLIIRDQIPVSKNSEITVSFDNPDRAEADEQGIIRWNIHLEAGEEKVLRFGYAIEWPVDKAIDITENREYEGRSDRGRTGSRKFCHSCGSVLTDDQVFCPVCGQRR